MLIVYITVVALYAQAHMRIHHKGGEYFDVPLEQIDSITFVDGEEGHAEELELAGSWIWGDVGAGYYELLTFNDDKTYTCCDYYFTYGFDTMTYGWYIRYGNLLTLQSNGFGYNRKYTWFVMGLTENALDVMTKMGQFTFYRLQKDVITLRVGEIIECTDGDSYIFADGITINTNNNKLYGIKKGVTYILKKNISSNNIVSIKVIVD